MYIIFVGVTTYIYVNIYIYNIGRGGTFFSVRRFPPPPSVPSPDIDLRARVSTKTTKDVILFSSVDIIT